MATRKREREIFFTRKTKNKTFGFNRGNFEAKGLSWRRTLRWKLTIFISAVSVKERWLREIQWRNVLCNSRALDATLYRKVQIHGRKEKRISGTRILKLKFALKDFGETEVDVKGFISVRPKRAWEYILAENVCKLLSLFATPRAFNLYQSSFTFIQKKEIIRK